MTITADAISTTLKIPILENGDQLKRMEFEYRYQAMPHHLKAEIIEGIVYMASPVSAKRHARTHAEL